MEKICGIYYIKNLINNKYYVGQSRDIHHRWVRERAALKRDKLAWNIHLQNAWKKYGEDNFEFKIVEECSVALLDEREMFWIDKFDSFYNGYNKTLGGDGFKGSTPWNKGIKLSEPYRKKLSDAHKNQKHTEAQIQKLREKFSGENNPHYGKFGFDSSKGSAVYCITLDRFFGSAADAERILILEGVAKPNAHSILNCCKNLKKYKTSGKLQDGTRLEWRYATQDEIDLLNNNDIK